MASHRIDWVRRLFRSGTALPPELQRAKDLIASIDAGGIPLNPARINDIARNLGLDVARTAPTDDTIRRIRQAIERSCPST